MQVIRQTPHRPRLVNWLGLGVLVFSAIYLTRLILGLNLPALPFAVPAWYIPVTGGLWGIGALVDAIALFCRMPWAPRVTRIGTGVYLAWFWLDRVLLVQSKYHRSTWPLALVASLLALGAVTWTLNHPTVRDFFEEKAK